MKRSIAIVVAASAGCIFLLWIWYPEWRINSIASQMDVEDVSFYARVLDQHDQPVPDAIVRFSIMGSMLGGYTSGVGRTSASGGIRMTGKGGAITIMGIQKPGYIFLGADCFSNGCAFDSTDYFAAVDKQDREKTWYEHRTPESAYVFRVHKLGNIPGVESGMFSFSRLDANHWQTYQLTPKNDRSDEEGFPGQLRARLLDNSDDGWKVELQAASGGIQLAPQDDAYMSIAPESGYQDTYVFDCQVENACRSGGRRRFYFYANGGKEYGAMVVTIGRRIDGAYRINTRGNRDLNTADLKNLDLDGVYR